jgi:hypothetical protein
MDIEKLWTLNKQVIDPKVRLACPLPQHMRLALSLS